MMNVTADNCIVRALTSKTGTDWVIISGRVMIDEEDERRRRTHSIGVTRAQQRNDEGVQGSQRNLYRSRSMCAIREN